MSEVDAALRAATRDAQRSIGPIYEVDDEGNRANISHRLELPEVEQRKFRAAGVEALASGRLATESAVEALAQELAVLQMMGAEGLATAARQVGLVAEGLIHNLGDDGLVAAQQDALNTTIARLWSVANGAE